jgi:hypothetical protein
MGMEWNTVSVEGGCGRGCSCGGSCEGGEGGIEPELGKGYGPIESEGRSGSSSPVE